MGFTFRVDLRGVVDLLSHHLYATPRVYVRELLQNAVDAITARRLSEPRRHRGIWFEPAERTGDGTLRVHDTGIGLTEDQVHELLATIGRSSKRDDLGFARHEFLGQFGIGLLSCFMVADEIRVVTRCGDEPTVLGPARARPVCGRAARRAAGRAGHDGDPGAAARPGALADRADRPRAGPACTGRCCRSPSGSATTRSPPVPPWEARRRDAGGPAGPAHRYAEEASGLLRST